MGATVAKLVIEEGHWSYSPESLSGHVQIFKFAIESFKSGTSIIDFWMRPDILFSIEK